MPKYLKNKRNICYWNIQRLSMQKMASTLDSTIFTYIQPISWSKLKFSMKDEEDFKYFYWPVKQVLSPSEINPSHSVPRKDIRNLSWLFTSCVWKQNIIFWSEQYYQVTMSGVVLSGTQVSADIKAKLQEQVREIQSKDPNFKPGLVIVQVKTKCKMSRVRFQ